MVSLSKLANFLSTLPKARKPESKTSAWKRNVIAAEENALKERHYELERLLKSMRDYIDYATTVGRTEVGFQFTSAKDRPCNWKVPKGTRFYQWPTLLPKTLNQWIMQNPTEFTEVIQRTFPQLEVTSKGSLCRMELDGKVIHDNVKVLSLYVVVL